MKFKIFGNVLINECEENIPKTAIAKYYAGILYYVNFHMGLYDVIGEDKKEGDDIEDDGYIYDFNSYFIKIELYYREYEFYKYSKKEERDKDLKRLTEWINKGDKNE